MVSYCFSHTSTPVRAIEDMKRDRGHQAMPARCSTKAASGSRIGQAEPRYSGTEKWAVKERERASVSVPPCPRCCRDK